MFWVTADAHDFFTYFHNLAKAYSHNSTPNKDNVHYLHGAGNTNETACRRFSLINKESEVDDWVKFHRLTADPYPLQLWLNIVDREERFLATKSMKLERISDQFTYESDHIAFAHYYGVVIERQRYRLRWSEKPIL